MAAIKTRWFVFHIGYRNDMSGEPLGWYFLFTPHDWRTEEKEFRFARKRGAFKIGMNLGENGWYYDWDFGDGTKCFPAPEISDRTFPSFPLGPDHVFGFNSGHGETGRGSAMNWTPEHQKALDNPLNKKCLEALGQK